MIKRQLQPWLEQQQNSPQIIQIQGLRQTGKTTLMTKWREAFPEALHYPLQNLITLQRFESEPTRLVLEVEQALQRNKSNAPLQVFLDEIQKVPELYQALQGLYDEHKGKIKFWIWGSSALPQKRKKAETLAGRILTKTLWPLSQAEILRQESIVPFLHEPKNFSEFGKSEPQHYSQELQRFFEQSALPEPYLLNNTTQAFQLLEAYQATYFENEIRRENIVHDIGVFQKFLQMAASENTHICNYSAQAKVLGISPLTVQKYYHILEDTFVVKKLPAFSNSLRVQTAKSPKMYFTDVGLARTVARDRSEILPHTQAYGHMVEAFVLLELQKQAEYHSLPWQFSYWKTKTGIEVDIVIETGRQLIACEVKSSRKIDPSHYQDLQKFMHQEKQTSFGLIFSLDPRIGEIAPRIYHIPLWLL